MQTLCIIPARGGSKGVVKKNLTTIGGKSLFYHASECVKKSLKIGRTIVSTDSEDIAAEARILGLEVPFLRPPEFAKDETPDFPVFRHALEWLKQNENYAPDIIVHLRVTSPFAFKRSNAQIDYSLNNWTYMQREKVIDDAIQLLTENNFFDCMRTVELVHDTPYKMWNHEDGKLIPLFKEKEIYNQPRQKLPKVYLQNGYADITWSKTILEKNSMTGDKIGGYILNCDYFIDIDNYADIEIGNLIYRNILGRGGQKTDDR